MRPAAQFAASSRPLTLQEQTWVEPRLERSPVGDPGKWFFRLVIGGYILLIAGVVVSNVGYYYAIGEDGIVLFLIVWTMLVLGKAWLDGVPAGSKRETVQRDASLSVEALSMTGRCEFRGRVPFFLGLPCHLPPGWDEDFPDGAAAVEVVPGHGGRHWIVVGTSSRRLDRDLEKGLLEYSPARPRTLLVVAVVLCLSLVPLELTGSVYGSASWDDLWGAGAKPVVVQSEQDFDPAWLDPGREVEVHGLAPFAGEALPPDGNRSLAPFQMMPKQGQWQAYDEVMKRIDCRLENRKRLLQGGADSVANGTFPCLEGNRNWRIFQMSLLDFPLVKNPAREGLSPDAAAFFNDGRQRMVRLFLEKGMVGFRNEETRMLDSLAKDAVAALNSTSRLIWVRGASDDEVITRAGRVSVGWEDDLAAIESKIHASFPDMEPVEAVVLEKHAKGWILRRSYRHRVVVVLVTAWLGVVAVGVPWLLFGAWRQSRRNRSYLRSVSIRG